MEPQIFELKMVERNFADIGGAINVDALAKCEEVFARVVDGRLDNLEKAIQARDSKEIEMLAHQMKGSFLVLGGDALAQRCLTLEKGAATLDLGVMTEIHAYLKKNLPEFRAQLAKAIQNLRMSARPSVADVG